MRDVSGRGSATSSASKGSNSAWTTHMRASGGSRAASRVFIGAAGVLLALSVSGCGGASGKATRGSAQYYDQVIDRNEQNGTYEELGGPDKAIRELSNLEPATRRSLVERVKIGGQSFVNIEGKNYNWTLAHLTCIESGDCALLRTILQARRDAAPDRQVPPTIKNSGGGGGGGGSGGGGD